MKKIGIIISTALLVFLSSCDKDDVNPNEPQPEGSRIKKITYSSEEYTSFTYNPDNSISKIIFAEAGEINNANFSYANGLLGEIQTDDGLAYQFRYRDGKAGIVDVVEDGVGKISFNELTYYTSSGYLKQITTYSKTTNPAILPPFLRITYDYYNDNTGNVKEARYYFWNENTTDFVLEKIIEYSQYDNKLNPFAQFGITGYLLFGVNSSQNPGKIVEKEKTGQVTSTSTFAYTYNSKGLPVQAVETVVDNNGTETNTVTLTY